MKNKTKTKKEEILSDNDKYSILNHSFQNSEANKKFKLKYSFIENFKSLNWKKNIILKINQIQINQQIANNKLSYLINILFSKLIANKNYKLFHNHFSIIQNKKYPNIKKENNDNFFNKRIKTEINQENHSERITKNNIKKKKIENISLATEIEIRRYNLSNQKTKSKENIFKLNEKFDNNKNENEEFYSNSNSNLFRMNNNNNNSLNKNPSTDNLNNQKKMFYFSNNRKPIIFNEISANLNNQNINKNNYYYNNIDFKTKTNNQNNDYKKVYLNPSNSMNNQIRNNNINNSMNKEKDGNKSNISENKLNNKGPVKIKLNPIEKPILLMNFNENMNKNTERKINKNNVLNNVINISNNSQINESKTSKNINNINGNKRLSLNIEDSSNNLNYKNNNGDDYINSIRGKRKFSEARSEADMNYSNLSDAKSGVGYSRKIRGFNFRNNIKFNKKPNSSKMSEDTYNKIKGGSVRYSNTDGIFPQINNVESEYKK